MPEFAYPRLNNIGIDSSDSVFIASIVIANTMHIENKVYYDKNVLLTIKSVDLLSDEDKYEFSVLFNQKSETPVLLDITEEDLINKTYFITDGTYVKIGITQDIQKRIAQIQTGNPKKLTLVHLIDDDLERYYHDKFKKYRVSGEWFLYNNQIKKHIQKLKNIS